MAIISVAKQEIPARATDLSWANRIFKQPCYIVQTDYSLQTKVVATISVFK